MSTGSQRYSPEFKDEAVRQVVERGYSIREVAERLGVSSHSLYKWVKDVRPDKLEQHAQELVETMGEILKLRAESRRTQEEEALGIAPGLVVGLAQDGGHKAMHGPTTSFGSVVTVP